MANLLPSPTPLRETRLALFLLCAATLVFEINLTRLFSVAQFYHFAFMIVSLALLGFGASGSFLSIASHFGKRDPQRALSWLALGCGASALAAYLLTNWLPFDSFSIAWEPKQAAVLALHYLALATPFLFSGLATGMLLNVFPDSAGPTYAINLLGSATGCLLALLAPSSLGGEGVIMLSAGLAGVACLVCLFDKFPHWHKGKTAIQASTTGVLIVLALLDIGLRLAGNPSFSWMSLQISPYKGLSYAMQYPDAQVVFQRWNAFSRVDVVRSSGVRSLPGLSYRYMKAPPAEDGLMVDADEMNAILLPGYASDFFDYLPGAIVYRLRPEAHALILEPRGGLDVLTALALGAQEVTAVEPNPLVVEAASFIYTQPRVNTVIETGRSFTRRSSDQFDTVVISLANAYHPVRSGAYSLAEDYRYTVEAFEDALKRLSPDGLLQVTRWLQNPPSESLRTFGLAVEAVEGLDGDPRTQIVALRGYNTATLLIKISPFDEQELASIRAWAADRAFDLVHAPGMNIKEANQYNVLPEPLYYLAFRDLLAAPQHEDFYTAYPYEVRPPTDDRPFFGHYFKWSQIQQTLAEFGKTWQPFGGAGYFVLVALLVLASGMALGVIVLPVAVFRLRGKRTDHGLSGTSEPRAKHMPFNQALPFLIYFGLIGLGFMMVEIPLFQRFILFLGHPAYSLTAVLFTLLLFSGVGSQFSKHFPLRFALALLVVLLIVGPPALPGVFKWGLGLPLAGRLMLTAILLSPLGFLMGTAFPGGIRWMLAAPGGENWVPWIWAVNGAASVIASVLAALLAISFGFTWVFWLGAACYAGAWITILGSGQR